MSFFSEILAKGRSEVRVAIPSALTLIVATFLTYQTKIYPFIALFSFDAPDAMSHLLPWVVSFGLFCAPLCAIGSAICAFVNLSFGSGKLLLVSVALCGLPLVAYGMFTRGHF